MPVKQHLPAANRFGSGSAALAVAVAIAAGLAACGSKGNFFTQQLCIQETRWKYCGAPLSPDPLWGKIPECPNSSSEQNNP